jgi:hypothetical protein
MVRQHLHSAFGIVDGAMTVRRHMPEDFLVCSSHHEDLETVLGTPSDNGAPFTLIWMRMSQASVGLFKFKVVVGLKNIPAHARSLENVQLLLGSSCANVELPSLVDEEEKDDGGDLHGA